jgi:SAM-dependent methyltransferase
MTVDPRAVSGFAAAEAYERGRPAYPPEAIADLVRELGLNARSTVLDLAAGTGKLTGELVRHAGRVIAVEPSAGMLEVIRSRLPEVDARAGTAEAIPAAAGAVEAVFVGEAFHWFRTAAASAEIARVLVPRGGLALLWNRAEWSDDDLPWHSEFESVSLPYRTAAGDFPGETWRAELESTGRFEPLRSSEVEHVRHTDPEGFVALVGSWSWIVNLPAEERTRFLARVRELIGDQRVLTLRYRTEVYWTVKTAR